MSNKFKVEKSKILSALGVISFRDKLDRRILNFSPEGLKAFENSSSSAFAIVECSKDFFIELPDSEFSMIVSDGFKAGLNSMGEGIISFSLEEMGQEKQSIRMEEIDENGIEKTTYEEPLIIPQGDEAVFPIETGVIEDKSEEETEDNSFFELKMIAPKVLTVIVDSEKLKSLHKSDIERYRMVWKPDGTLFVTTEIRNGGVLKKTISVNYIETPQDEVKIDIEPVLFHSQLRNFSGEIRLTVHVTDSVRGITMTQRAGDYDIGYTLIGMNPI